VCVTRHVNNSGGVTCQPNILFCNLQDKHCQCQNKHINIILNDECMYTKIRSFIYKHFYTPSQNLTDCWGGALTSLYCKIKPFRSVSALVCAVNRLYILQGHADWRSWHENESLDGKTDKICCSGVETESPYSLHQQYINMANGLNCIHKNSFQN
jgi:hypothetical protein